MTAIGAMYFMRCVPAALSGEEGLRVHNLIQVGAGACCWRRRHAALAAMVCGGSSSWIDGDEFCFGVQLIGGRVDTTGMASADRAEPEHAKERGDHPDFTGKTCFVIMPYGRMEKPAPSAAHSASERQHFDEVYDFICKVVAELGIRPLRSDRSAEALPIHAKMLTDIIDADLAIVDITNLNPNVFYELGVRHTARRHSTVLIGFAGTAPPFNLSGVRVISYDLTNSESIAASTKKLRDAVVANLSARATDSLVHSLLPGLNLSRPQQALKHDCEVVSVPFSPSRRLRNSRASMTAAPTFTLGIIKGDLVDIDMVDVWVNPESTRMDMARIHDATVSAFIRYHGAKKDPQGNVIDDLVHQALLKRVLRSNVEAGRVIVTRPGELRRMNVRAIFHVAAQHGEPCNGYHTIRSYTSVVSNALETMDELNEKFWKRWMTLGETRALKSIVFPLLGVHSRDLDAIEVTENLVREARKYLTLWPDTQIQAVYFLLTPSVTLSCARRLSSVSAYRCALRAETGMRGSWRARRSARPPTAWRRRRASGSHRRRPHWPSHAGRAPARRLSSSPECR